MRRDRSRRHRDRSRDRERRRSRDRGHSQDRSRRRRSSSRDRSGSRRQRSRRSASDSEEEFGGYVPRKNEVKYTSAPPTAGIFHCRPPCPKLARGHPMDAACETKSSLRRAFGCVGVAWRPRCSYQCGTEQSRRRRQEPKRQTRDPQGPLLLPQAHRLYGCAHTPLLRPIMSHSSPLGLQAHAEGFGGPALGHTRISIHPIATSNLK